MYSNNETGKETEKEKGLEATEIRENDEKVLNRFPEPNKLQQMLDESKKVKFLYIDEKKGQTCIAGEAKKFEKKHKEIIAATNVNGCVLHHVARIDGAGENYISFIEWCVRKKHMLASLDTTSNYTPLHTALSQRNDSFVKGIIDITRSKKKLAADAISAVTHSKHNCLHLAIEHSSIYTKDLIESCRDYLETDPEYAKKIFKQPMNDDSLTPMHLIMDPYRGYDKTDPEPRLNVMKALIDADPDSLECRTEKHNLTPYQYRLSFLERDVKGKFAGRRRSSALESRKIDREISLELRKQVDNDPLASYIRMFCIRSFSRDKALKMLYSPGQERNIDFDLSGLQNQSISVEYLNNLATHLQFESVLKYVALPKLIVGTDQEDLKDKKINGRGLKELTKIFDWLRKNHVNKIIKVIIVDDGDTSHSDSAIREAVRGFDIRVWDWKKTDLCSDVIFDVASDVEEVTLYSSGNNAVLLGWASLDGFMKFPKLNNIKLYYRIGLEDPIEYVKQFKAKLENGIDIKCIHCRNSNGIAPGYRRIAVETIWEDDANPVTAGFRDPHAITDRSDNEWMACIKDFAIFLRNIKGDNLQEIPEIRIAVIDSGIDATLSMFKGRIALGKSFCRYPDSEECLSQYYVPNDDHGTKMAYFICQVFPKVRLYIARLDSAESSNGRQQFTAKSAAEAIKWSVECGVDIISMSWTIESKSPEGEEMKRLKEALTLAETKRILMFCSADDRGSISSDHCYPNVWDKCLLIGAANDTGSMCDWVPAHKASQMFIFPGLNIPFSAGIGIPDSPESGSSVATAIAAGLAGVLLFCDALTTQASGPVVSQIAPSFNGQPRDEPQYDEAAGDDKDSILISDDGGGNQHASKDVAHKMQTIQESQSGRPISHTENFEDLRTRDGMGRALSNLSNLSNTGPGNAKYPRLDHVLHKEFKHWSWKLHRETAKAALIKFMTDVKKK